MIVEGEYFYKGVHRLSWGFGSPNQLGAFVAAIIPFLWAMAPIKRPDEGLNTKIRSRKERKAPAPVAKSTASGIAQTAALAAELGLWIGLGATASRGAAVAALGAALSWSWAQSLTSQAPKFRSAAWLGLRILMCLAGMVIFSFGGRISPGFLARDASIGNRFILWSGAARLIAASPANGWGTGESGNAFMQWVQPLDRPEQYRTMVNGFLHVGVERGLPAFGLLSFLTMVGVSWAFVLERHVVHSRLRVLVRSSSAVLLSWALSNVFSTLFRDWRLWIFPTLAFAFLLGSTPWVRVPLRRLRGWFLGTLSAAALACASLWLIGWRLEARQTIGLARPTRGLVELSRDSLVSNPEWGVLVDPLVFGPRYGHEIRRWGERIPPGQPWSAAVFDGRFWPETSPQAKQLKNWILAGETAQIVEDLAPSAFIVFLHPRGQPPRNWAGSGVVIFNEIDEEGTREAWMDWAVRRHLRIETIASVGLDARSVWPEAFSKDLVAIP